MWKFSNPIASRQKTPSSLDLFESQLWWSHLCCNITTKVMTFWFKSISLLHSWDLTWTTLQWRTIHNSISLNTERNNNRLRWCLLRYMEYLPSQMKFIETSFQTVFFLTGSAHYILMKTRIWCLMFYWEDSTITGHHLRRSVWLFFCCRLICICFFGLFLWEWLKKAFSFPQPRCIVSPSAALDLTGCDGLKTSSVKGKG